MTIAGGRDLELFFYLTTDIPLLMLILSPDYSFILCRCDD